MHYHLYASSFVAIFLAVHIFIHFCCSFACFYFCSIVYRVVPFLQRAPESPPQVSIANAVTLLTQIGALDTSEELTYFGKYLALLPMDPRLARMLM